MKPADFPLGSHQSRAAARSLLIEKQCAHERREVIISYPADSPSATEWVFDAKERSAGRVVSIPDGMTLEQGLRALGGYSESELAQAREFSPEPVNAGTMLMVRR